MLLSIFRCQRSDLPAVRRNEASSELIKEPFVYSDYFSESGCKGKGFFRISKTSELFFFKKKILFHLPPHQLSFSRPVRPPTSRHNCLTIRHFAIPFTSVFAKNPMAAFRFVSGSGCKDKPKVFKLPNQSGTFFESFFFYLFI